MAYSVAALTLVPDRIHQIYAMRHIQLLTKSNCLLWLCLAFLAGCGQRGPLYLPEQSSVTTPSQEQAQAQAQAQAEGEEEIPAGEPVPDIVPDPVPEPAAVEDDE